MREKVDKTVFFENLKRVIVNVFEVGPEHFGELDRFLSGVLTQLVKQFKVQLTASSEVDPADILVDIAADAEPSREALLFFSIRVKHYIVFIFLLSHEVEHGEGEADGHEVDAQVLLLLLLLIVDSDLSFFDSYKRFLELAQRYDATVTQSVKDRPIIVQ